MKGIKTLEEKLKNFHGNIMSHLEVLTPSDRAAYCSLSWLSTPEEFVFGKTL